MGYTSFVVVLFVLFASSISSLPSYTVTVPPTAPSVQYLGRVQYVNNDVHFDWSGIQILFNFTGTGLTAHFADSTSNTYNVFVDGVEIGQINTTSSKTSYSVASGLRSGFHAVVLTKRNEAFLGVATFQGFDVITEDPAATKASIVKRDVSYHMDPQVSAGDRRIEFIGDSITCGYGDEGHPPCGYSIETQTEYLAYGFVTARALQAEVHVECWSGKGMVRNYGDQNITSKDPFPIYYPRTLANDPNVLWQFNSWIPQAVVINLGTNDYSTQPQPPQNVFADAYNNFISMLQRNYGTQVKIFAVCGPMIGNPCCQYVKAIVQQHSSQGVYYVDLENLLNNNDVGCDYHPNVQGQAKMAARTIPVIKSVMGW